jgi:hypothetical protein
VGSTFFFFGRFRSFLGSGAAVAGASVDSVVMAFSPPVDSVVMAFSPPVGFATPFFFFFFPCVVVFCVRGETSSCALRGGEDEVSGQRSSQLTSLRPKNKRAFLRRRHPLADTAPALASLCHNLWTSPGTSDHDDEGERRGQRLTFVCASRRRGSPRSCGNGESARSKGS